jgi:membrane-associated phospholipid phosphatase
MRALAAAALVYALVYAYLGLSGAFTAPLILAPIVLAYLLARSWLAAAFVILLPMYFFIGAATAAWPHYRPMTILDGLMPLRPGWMTVYGSLYVCGFLLPLLVVRGEDLIGRTLKAYLTVMVISYAGFLVYPTVAPRQDVVVVTGFAEWTLQLFYDLDQPYGCFPSLHVAYSFVAAFACLQMNRSVGIAALVWSVLIGVSTVYTKQHYVVDAVAGALIATVTWVVFLRTLRPHVVSETDRRAAVPRALSAALAYVGAVAVFWIAFQFGLGPEHAVSTVAPSIRTF